MQLRSTASSTSPAPTMGTGTGQVQSSHIASSSITFSLCNDRMDSPQNLTPAPGVNPASTLHQETALYLQVKPLLCCLRQRSSVGCKHRASCPLPQAVTPFSSWDPSCLLFPAAVHLTFPSPEYFPCDFGNTQAKDAGFLCSITGVQAPWGKEMHWQSENR